MQDQFNYEEKEEKSKQRIATCNEALKFLFYVNDKMQKSSDLDQKLVYQKSLHHWNLMKKEEQEKQQQKIDNTKQKEQNILKNFLQEKEKSSEIDISNLNALQSGYQQVQKIQIQLQQDTQESNHKQIQETESNLINEKKENDSKIEVVQLNEKKIQVHPQKIESDIKIEQKAPYLERSDHDDYIMAKKINSKLKNSKTRQSTSNQKRVLSQSKKKQFQNLERSQNTFNCNNEMTIEHLKELVEQMLKDIN
ncbi:unnamed protein product [Paramecium sonneborni]|uniref:Uncharacterized protein n=1 Tax=Paramecium sonneborni TaxID=65129 RepID=A0A8S1N911_9CILI|nr:unnamed protein product [Paramecium sonneborni]